MSWLSKTTQPCDCGMLAWALNEPEPSVYYDTLHNAFALRTGIGTHHRLSHCWSCGGAFPDTTQVFSIPVVPPEPLARLRQLTSEVRTEAQMRAAWGEPDFSSPAYSETPIVTYRYYRLLLLTTVECHVQADGSAYCQVEIQCRSPQVLDDLEGAMPSREFAVNKGYWIVSTDVSQPDAFRVYAAANGEMLTRYGARILARTGQFTLVEGRARARTTLIEFSSYQAALDCWHSIGSAQASKLCEGAAEVDVVVIEGRDGLPPG